MPWTPKSATLVDWTPSSATPADWKPSSASPIENEGIIAKVKRKANTFITSHLDELAGKKPGILNPNPDENYLINKSLIPDIPELSNEDPRYKFGRITGNFIKNSIATPLGILGMFHGKNIPEEPIGMPEEFKVNITEPLNEPQIRPRTRAILDSANVPASSTSQATSNPSSMYRQIPSDAKVKDAVRQWAYGREGSRVRASQIKNQFKDLTDPELVGKYESGDRTGRLADVEKHLQDRLKQGREAGIFQAEQEVPNYLRHEFTQSPEEVQAAMKTYITQNPSIARTRRFPTYAAAQQAGLTPKYNNISDILGSYETKFNQALRNKEFYDWLHETGRLKAGEPISSPSNWTFQGQDAPELAKLVGNVLGKSPEGLHKLANTVSFTKNLYLGSGVPKTPLNMHMYNITRSDMMSRGIRKGLGDFFSGVFKPAKDVATIEQHTNSGLIADLVDHGMGWKDIEDHAALASGLQEPSAAKNILSKVSNFQQRVFEDPLFKIHLPAVKVKFASERVKELIGKGLTRDNALTQAAQEANDFYGGINKVLRNKTYTDLSRIGLLAPDWLESRANLAGKGISALVGKSDPLYAKALGRGALMRVAGAGVTAGVTGSLLNQSKRSTNTSDIPLGETQTGKNRNFPIYGSAVEGLKIPEELAAGRDLGNVLTSRISQPAKSVYHITANEDAFGNPLRGRDKYGKKIPLSTSLSRTGKEVLAPITPPWVLMLQQLLTGEDPEASIGTGLELPFKYNSEPKRR